MANVASFGAFQVSMSAVSQHDCPHVWIDSDGRMLLGCFPRPSRFFDFGKECFFELEQKPIAIDERSGIEATKEAELPSLEAVFVKPKERISLIHLAPRITEIYEIETVDSIYVVGSATQALFHGLNKIEQAAPGTLEILSGEKKRSKRPVSLKREELYEKPSQRRYALKLENGYWVATNNKAFEAINVLKNTARLAQLTPAQFSVRKRR